MKTCGLKMRVLWIKSEIGELLSSLGDPRASFWHKSLELFRGKLRGEMWKCLAMWGLEIRLGQRN